MVMFYTCYDSQAWYIYWNILKVLKISLTPIRLYLVSIYRTLVILSIMVILFRLLYVGRGYTIPSAYIAKALLSQIDIHIDIIISNISITDTTEFTIEFTGGSYSYSTQAFQFSDIIEEISNDVIVYKPSVPVVSFK